MRVHCQQDETGGRDRLVQSAVGTVLAGQTGQGVYRFFPGAGYKPRLTTDQISRLKTVFTEGVSIFVAPYQEL